MKIWKKLCVFALCACMTLSLAACGSGNRDDENFNSGMSGTYENDGDVNLDDKDDDRNGDGTMRDMMDDAADDLENMVDDAGEDVNDMVNDVTDGDAGTDGNSGGENDSKDSKDSGSGDKKSESDRNENSR